MSWDDAAFFLVQIGRRADAFDRRGVSEICDDLVGRLLATDAVFPSDTARRILAALRRKRYFDLLETMAEAFLRTGQSSFEVQRQYAQAMIDQGKVSAAIPVLKTLAEETRDLDRGENREARGLLGRAFKQLYVDSGGVTHRSRRNLATAVRWYAGVYHSDASHFWHGINVVALLCRAARDSVDVDGFPRPLDAAREIAARILAEIEDLWRAGRATLWDSATAAEACVALESHEGALRWLGRYVAEPYTDAFELASTHRQLVEVWQLDAGSDLVAVLKAELLKRQGSRVELSPGELKRSMPAEQLRGLEKVLGKTRYVTLKDMQRALARGQAVGRVEDQPDHGVGSGFLIRGGDLHPSLGDELLFLTNAHVVSDDVAVSDPPPLLPDEAKVTFQMIREHARGERYEFDVELLWTSPPGRLDATLLRLDGAVEGIEPYPVHPRLPLADGEQRVYVIGHPAGGTLSYSIQDNVLLDHEGPPDGDPRKPGVVRLHYRAPTEGGSSGSPVFNRQWKLIGIHHAGSPEMPKLNKKAGNHPANEGIWIQSIIEAMKQQPP